MNQMHWLASVMLVISTAALGWICWPMFDLRCGLLFRLEACWIGVHYSGAYRRFCINPVPFCTLWITLKGGTIPYQVRNRWEPQ